MTVAIVYILLPGVYKESENSIIYFSLMLIINFYPKVKLMERPARVKLYKNSFFTYNFRDIIRACMKKLLNY